MKSYLKVFCLFLVLIIPLKASASDWVYNVNVTTIGSYQMAKVHFVWTTQTPAGCTGVLYFSEDNSGGKSLFNTLTAALLTKANVDIQAEACVIVEVYLKGS